jgi:hypothetical protein
VRPVEIIALGAQVDHRRELFGMQACQPADVLAEPVNLDGQRRFVAPLSPAPRDPRQEHARLAQFDQLEIEQFFLIY